MQINPQIQELLKQFPVDLPDTLTPEIIKEIREVQLPIQELVRPEIWETKDQLIPGPNGDIPIRIYTPKEQDELYSSIVAYHGGGWAIGNIEEYDGVFRQLSNVTGCKVISVEYRLAPEHPFPMGIEDCYTALQWVFDNNEQLQIDKNRIAVAGDSAGGNLSAGVTLMAKDRKGPKIWKQVLIYPATDALRSIEDSPYGSIHENKNAPILTSSLTKSFWDFYLSNEEDANNPYCSPIKAEDLSNLPPAYIVTAELDPVRDEGELYGTLLQESDVPVRVKRLDGFTHGFIVFPLPEVGEVMQEIADFLNE